MTRSFIQWGLSALNDEPLLSVSHEAQGAFPWLLAQAALSDGVMTRIAAVRFLHGRGWPDAAGTVDELIAAGLIKDNVMSGWAKYQAAYVAQNDQRATTREGRRRRLSREADEARLETVDRSTRGVPDVDAIHNRSTPPYVDRSTRGVPSLLVSSPPNYGNTTESETTQKTARGELPDDRDIQDTLYELTQFRPWGKDWGKRALALEDEFGSAADVALRQVASEHLGAKPWDLTKLAGDRLERDRDKAKSAQLREATAHRRARANGAATTEMSQEEIDRIMSIKYEEPPTNG